LPFITFISIETKADGIPRRARQYRHLFLDLLGELTERFSIEAHAYVLMGNHSDVLGFNLETARKAKRIAAGEKEKRDMLIYLLWKRGGLSNREIGTWLGVTYSMVSKVVSSFGERIQAEREVRANFKRLNSHP